MTTTLSRQATPFILTIFGATGDLTRRLILPAIYNLAVDGRLPEKFAIIGSALPEMTDEQFQAFLTEAIEKFCTVEFDRGFWTEKLAPSFHYSGGNFGDPELFKNLSERSEALEEKIGDSCLRLFYFAVAPNHFATLSDQIAAAGLHKSSSSDARVIIEKPFGYDLNSATELNRQLLKVWQENQLYRIDHYLGKETVQNLLVFRFANGIFEPIWNRNFIDHVQITVAETVGVEGREKYYDRSGAVRDMMQNHLLQLMAYVGMEVPNSFDADPVRDKKSELLEAIRDIPAARLGEFAVRGQYGEGYIGGQKVAGYRHEPDVNPDSSTETYVAIKLWVDNWRWSGVPFYLRTGKRLLKREAEIVIVFKHAPEVVFRTTPVDALSPNRLIFNIQPEQTIELDFLAKEPGPVMQIQKANMAFDYHNQFKASRGTGYERLLRDFMLGDLTLFSRSDLIEEAWRVVQPLLSGWESKAERIPIYEAGSSGPAEADELLSRDGREWFGIE
ncbi:MAG: glucose-6-phosphate dehydrogenase [Planctomycetota bacterium]|nr:glucose-6-phosphate dehydrogenase [Planctomycetota bacterium]